MRAHHLRACTPALPMEAPTALTKIFQTGHHNLVVRADFLAGADPENGTSPTQGAAGEALGKAIDIIMNCRAGGNFPDKCVSLTADESISDLVDVMDEYLSDGRIACGPAGVVYKLRKASSGKQGQDKIDPKVFDDLSELIHDNSISLDDDKDIEQLLEAVKAWYD